MARVQVLPGPLIDQIAAGEVVERPASVVKELVENALDAGAGAVTIEAEGGGVARLAVSDDGCGMEPEDALLALERHATSKVRTLEDLVRVATLGFRGEALPSIASVSRLVLTTSPDGSGLGSEVAAERGAPPRLRPARHPKGTRVVVEDLFGNVPARRKFLKGPEAELRAITRLVTALALSRPDVLFVLRSGERELLRLAPARDAGVRLAEVLGREAAGRIVPVSFSSHGLALSGAVTDPGLTYASRAHQWLFVNGRSARDATAQHAAQLAAREALRDDRFPGFALFLSSPPEACDVNVHPQKHEVRFRDPGAVHGVVHRGLLAALTAGKGAEELRGDLLLVPAPAAAGWGPGAPASGAAASALAETLGAWGEGVLLPASAAGTARSSYAASASAVVETPSPLGTLRLLGQYRDSYLLAESEAGLVVVDQHVAHERVRYERIRADLDARAPAAQALLVPETFEASVEEAAAFEGAGTLLEAAGFGVSALAGRLLAVTAVPAGLPAGAAVATLREFLARVAALPDDGPDASAVPDRAKDALAASIACRGAITVHRRLAPEEATRLLADLARCRDPYTCPHGRPIFLTLAHAELLKRFRRTTG